MAKNDDNATSYVLEPLVGLGPVRFGMTRAQVAKIVGPPTEVDDDDIVRIIYETRAGVTFQYWYDDKRTLGSVLFKKPASIRYRDIDLMKGGEALAMLNTVDPTGKDYGQYMHFPAVGLLLGGFGKRRIPEGKVIIAYGHIRTNFYSSYATV